MKCPLMFHLYQAKLDEKEYNLGDCFKEECAWWSKEYIMCDVNILTQELYELREALRDIKDKLPSPPKYEFRGRRVW